MNETTFDELPSFSIFTLDSAGKDVYIKVGWHSALHLSEDINNGRVIFDEDEICMRRYPKKIVVEF